jgi:hypothetical protein
LWEVHHFTLHVLICYPLGNNYQDLLSYEKKKRPDDLPLHGHWLRRVDFLYDDAADLHVNVREKEAFMQKMEQV